MSRDDNKLREKLLKYVLDYTIVAENNNYEMIIGCSETVKIETLKHVIIQ